MTEKNDPWLFIFDQNTLFSFETLLFLNTTNKLSDLGIFFFFFDISLCAEELSIFRMINL
jgi:hypothetical protein